jgi:hypothetical protein
MKQLRDLGFHKEYAPLKELSRKMSDYVKTGEPATFTIPFEQYGRIAYVTLPKNPQSRVQLTLKAIAGFDSEET